MARFQAVEVLIVKATLHHVMRSVLELSLKALEQKVSVAVASLHSTGEIDDPPVLAGVLTADVVALNVVLPVVMAFVHKPLLHAVNFPARDNIDCSHLVDEPTALTAAMLDNSTRILEEDFPLLSLVDIWLPASLLSVTLGNSDKMVDKTGLVPGRVSVHSPQSAIM
eukprot:CAMPEP_0197571508 /NCGR_PEP_ID=MMETSP1320-20131121/41993_1 /TAXON_ID=91990 /ORGANISM="Bolidomonas sp., Strain RCC2347" /LENGTH=166 /DNA_ID=CAMNT_0043134001 /DNA_START=136 /DNA_END=636 /DNA_ORIENTATION=+